MKVPYVEQWATEIESLRKIALDHGLTEETKWGKPCFTREARNIAIIIPLKETVAFSFFRGTLLKDPDHILKKIGDSQAGRWVKFTSTTEIAALKPTLKRYLDEAIAVAKSGKKVAMKNPADFPVPEELQSRLDRNSKLKAAFAALTPGRRKSHSFHVSGAKQPNTREARALKCEPLILAGLGFNEYER